VGYEYEKRKPTERREITINLEKTPKVLAKKATKIGKGVCSRRNRAAREGKGGARKTT